MQRLNQNFVNKLLLHNWASRIICRETGISMVLSKILRLLMAHPRYGPLMIQRLSESWPIRRAARFTAYIYLRGKQAIEENFDKSNQLLSKKIPFSGLKMTSFVDFLIVN